QSMCGGRIPCFVKEVDSQAALHVGHRAGQDRDRRAQLSEERHRDHSELGLRYKKELLPMKKEQVDLDNGLVHIADSKTANGIGDMPLTQAAREAFRRQMEETP